MQRMFDQQEKRFETLFSDQFETRFETLGNQLLTKVESVLSAVTTQLVNIQGKMAELEEHYLCMTDAQTKTNRTVQDLEQRLCDFSIEVEDKIDRLEAFSRRDNLKFFNIPQSRNESSDTCTERLLEFLPNAVPNKQWSPDDIVRAHRLDNNNNNNNGYTKPQPIIAKFAKWSDKMDILTKGRQQLKDLTTRQQKVIKDYRDRGQPAYYKGNKLVVAGPLPPRRWNQDSYADAARRQHRRRQDNPDTASGIEGPPPCEHLPHIQPRKRPGEFCRTGGQLAADYPRNCRRLLGRRAAIPQQLDGELQLRPVVRRGTGEEGPSAGATSSLPACLLRVGRTGLPALHRLGR